MVSNGQDSRGKSKRGGKELKAKAAALPPEQNATAWAQRLGIRDPEALGPCGRVLLRREGRGLCLELFAAALALASRILPIAYHGWTRRPSKAGTSRNNCTVDLKGWPAMVNT